ncbi:hypothetical protein EW026_g1816 [Hermanssonia centrifuga]|uniref:NAD-dependent epimerase/dehydratase domain-containing protein n=1 Tax=Hermanssonia centrifuga TaxID=98765 RepID=A0A4S4KQ84_9APHY|nr:hypothetical protein EW026_g1816 [Hermanssonia centrifuga]
MSSGALVLVTGISGFVGAHIVNELFKAGYRARGTVRSPKVATIKQWYKGTEYEGKVDVVVIDDLVAGDFTAAFQGVEGVIHAAAPLPGRASPEEALDAGIEGSMNVLRQAEKAGIKKFSVVSSIFSVNANFTTATEMMTHNDWTETTREYALSHRESTLVVYAAEKTLAERAIWEFAEKHPHIEVASVNPPFFLGPFAPRFTIPDGSISALSTNFIVYDFLRPDGPPPPHGSWIDPLLPRKSAANVFLMSGEEWLNAKDVVDYIAEVRPELKDRLSREAQAAPSGSMKNLMDNSRVKEVLGLVLTPWKTTIIEAVDDLIAIDKDWKSRGVAVKSLDNWQP